ncbi:MAG: hypothetical protein Q9165_001791 [Trypethelium subeluteriae]
MAVNLGYHDPEGDDLHHKTQPTTSIPSPQLKGLPSAPDPSRLAPEDAINSGSDTPRRIRQRSPLGMANGTAGKGNGVLTTSRDSSSARGANASLSNGRKRREKDTDKEKERARSVSRRRKGGKGTWKKLLWVKQSYPDNYTDEETFLDHLQRNPRLQPYEFWTLVADSTVIVQHCCSVLIFICCFVGIYQERVSPITIVSVGSLCTVLGWVIWDHWVGREEEARAQLELNAEFAEEASSGSISSNSSTATTTREPVNVNREGQHQSRGLAVSTSGDREPYSTSRNASNLAMNSTPLTPSGTGHPTGAASFANYSYYPPYGGTSSVSPRNQQRLATAKSAMLIYCALLGLSPILRSLTKSTTSDSIWAMSSWLMFINVFFFDYGGGVGAKFPASLSTNAAIMASTVLASRLPSTTHVFSLTLFSIEVFGLFPVFRRHLRHNSWQGHLALTCALVMGQGAGVGLIFPGAGIGAAIAGIIVSLLLTSLAMGICAWWLIGLQKYKNEIHGPWDPARPILRRHWD